MTELILIPLYLAALIGGSVIFHRRYKCVKASCFTGLMSSWVIVITILALEEKSTNPMEYLGAFIYAGIGLWIFSSTLSGFIGMPFQLRKD